MQDDAFFMVQPYVVKGRGLLAQPAQIYRDETEARRAGGRLARFRAGVVVLSQCIDPVTAMKGRPVTLAVYGQVPEDWGRLGKAA